MWVAEDVSLYVFGAFAYKKVLWKKNDIETGSSNLK